MQQQKPWNRLNLSCDRQWVHKLHRILIAVKALIPAEPWWRMDEGGLTHSPRWDRPISLKRMHWGWIIGIAVILSSCSTPMPETTTPAPTVTVVTEAPPSPTPKSTLSPSIPTTLCDAAGLPDAACADVNSNNDWQEYFEDFGGVQMVLVPSGCFTRGSSQAEIDQAVEMCQQSRGDDCQEGQYEDEINQFEVCFDKPFWIDRYEVTNANYSLKGGYEDSPGFVICNELYANDDESGQPRNCVSWEEASSYCAARGARLPTEAEWEYAARGPDRLIFAWGDEFPDVWSDDLLGLGDQLNMCDANCLEEWHLETVSDNYPTTAPVSKYQSGVSWVGAYNMSGNVWEWTADWYDEVYVSGLIDPPIYNPTGPSIGDHRVVRGGSWIDVNPAVFRTTYRGYLTPDAHWEALGFRCVRDVQD